MDEFRSCNLVWMFEMKDSESCFSFVNRKFQIVVIRGIRSIFGFLDSIRSLRIFDGGVFDLFEFGRVCNSVFFFFPLILYYESVVEKA